MIYIVNQLKSLQINYAYVLFELKRNTQLYTANQKLIFNFLFSNRETLAETPEGDVVAKG